MSNYKLDFTGEQVNELLHKVSKIGDGASSWNDLADKPFEETTVTLVDNQTIAISDGQGFISEVAIIEDGGVYTVIYNDVEYADLQTRTIDFGDGAFVYVIGNVDFVDGGDNGIPFMIMSADGYTAVQDMTGSESCTVTIVQSEITKIPAKFLENDLFVVEITFNEDESFSANKTYNEIISAINSGKNIFLNGGANGALQAWSNTGITFAAIEAAGSDTFRIDVWNITCENEISHVTKGITS